jgi:hypothetical protein
MRTRQRRLDDLMLDGAPEDALYEVPTLAYEPDAGAVDPNLVRPMLDDYLNAEAPPAPVQVTPEFTPPDDDDAWIGEMAASYQDPTPKRGYAPEDNSKAGDGGLSTAQAQGNESYSDGAWARVLAGAFDPGGIAGRRREAWERGQQPVKDWQEAQKLAQERRRNDENEAYRRDSLEARIDSQGGNLDARNRGLDIRTRDTNIRQRSTDPRSDWNDERNAEWRRRQLFGTDENIRQAAAAEAGKNRRTAMMSGRRDLMEQEGVLDPATGRRPVASQQEGMADMMRMRFEEEHIPITPRIQEAFAQLARMDNEGGQNNPLRAQYIGVIDDYYKDHKARTSGAAAEFGEDLQSTGLAAADDAYEEAMQAIRNNTRPDGTIAGFGTGAKLARNVAGVISTDLGREAQIAAGGQGSREVLTSVERFIAAEIFRFSGKAATNQERQFYMRMIPDSVFADSAELETWVRNIGAQIQRDKERIAQTHGVEGVETFANRGRGASAAIRAQTELREQSADPQQVVPAPQPDRIERGGRRYRVVPQ